MTEPVPQQEQHEKEEGGIRWISVKKVANELGIKPPTVWYYINTRSIPTRKFDFDKKKYIPIDRFQELLQEKRAAESGLR